MQVSTHLRKDKIDKEGLAPIRMLISGDGVKIFKVIPGIKCKLINWDETKGRLKPFKKNEEYNYYIEYNKIIDEHENKVKNIFRYLLLNNIKITANLIKEKLEVNENISLSINFLQGFEEFIKINKNTKTPRTIKGYRTVFNYLLEYQKKKSVTLHFDSINANSSDIDHPIPIKSDHLIPIQIDHLISEQNDHLQFSLKTTFFLVLICDSNILKLLFVDSSFLSHGFAL